MRRSWGGERGTSPYPILGLEAFAVNPYSKLLVKAYSYGQISFMNAVFVCWRLVW